VLALLWALTATGWPAEAGTYVQEISGADRDLAIQLAEAAMAPANGPRYAITVDRSADREGEPRRVVVLHYRYEDASAVVSLVDLDGSRLEEQVVYDSVTTQLSVAEREIAEARARSLPEVAAVQALYGDDLEAAGYELASCSRPSGGKTDRVVSFVFRQPASAGGGYVEGLGAVFVDLLSEESWIESPPASQAASVPTASAVAASSSAPLRPRPPAATAPATPELEVDAEAVPESQKGGQR
jgi:hypothetical protein